MSICRRKGSLKQVSRLNETKDNTAAPAVKGRISKLPFKQVATSTSSSQLTSNLKNVESEDMGQGRATTVYEDATLCSELQAGTPKGAERRGKEYNECILKQGKNAGGKNAVLRLETFDSKDADDCVIDRRLVGEATVRNTARKQKNIFREVSRKPCERKEKSSQREAPGKGVGKRKTVEKSRANEAKIGTIPALRFNAIEPSSGIDSSASISTLRSSSFSCKSKASGLAKDDLSPPSKTYTQLMPATLFNSRAGASESSQQVAGSFGRCDLLSESDTKVSEAVYTKIFEQEATKQDFLEFNFLEGEMVESELCKRTAKRYIGYLTPDHPDLGEGHPSFTSTGLSDEEWFDGSDSPAFYSASAFSPETCSETSYHSADEISLPSIDNELRHISVKDFVISQQLSHTAPNHTEGESESRLQGSQHFRQIEDHDKQCQDEKSDGLQSWDAQAGFGDVLFEAGINAHLSQASFTSALHPSPNQHEDDFLLEGPLLWNRSKAESGRHFDSCLSPTSCKHDKSGQGPGVNHCIEGELVVMSSERNSSTHFVGWQDSDTFSDSDFLDLRQFSQQGLQKTAKVFPVSSCISSSIARHTKGQYESADEVDFDLLLPGTSNALLSTCPSSKTRFEWKRTSLGVRVGLRSAVRNLEAALVGCRSTSIPKARPQIPMKYFKFASSRLLDGVLISPMRRKRNEFLKSLKGCTRPDSLQGKEYTRREELSLNVKSLLSTKVSLSMHSTNTAAFESANHEAGPLPTTSSQLETSCKPLLPDLKRAERPAAPQRENSPTNPVSSGQKLQPTLSPSSEEDSPQSMSKGYLQCSLRDGFPCYILTVDNSEDVLLAKAFMLESHSTEEECEWMYTFHSGRSKARVEGKGSWRSWIRKEKAASDLVGKMKVQSILCPEVAIKGETTNSVVSEFVLFDCRAQAAGQSHLRFCSSEIECLNAADSMRGASLTVSLASPSAFSPVAASRLQTTEKQVSPNLTNATTNFETISTSPGLSSPFSSMMRYTTSFSLDDWSHTDMANSELRPLSPRPRHMEIAAMVIRVPAKEHERESSGGDHHTRIDKWGWYHNVHYSCNKFEASLSDVHAISNTHTHGHIHGEKGAKHGAIPARRAFNIDRQDEEVSSSPTTGSSDHKVFMDISRDTASWNTKSEKIIRRKKVHYLNPSKKTEDNQHRTLQMAESVTVILPRGNHGLPNDKLSGPSSLIERWKCGGKCDCGSWDLGCGLTVLSTVNKANSAKNSAIQSLSQSVSLDIFSQVTKQEVMLSLSTVHQGFFQLSFRSHMSLLQAFATAVAILHTKESFTSGDTRITIDNLKGRAPFAPHNHFAPLRRRASSRSEDKAISAFSDFCKDFRPSPGSPLGKILK